MQITVNGELRGVEPAWQDERLLDVLREHFGLVGCKYGCGAAQCGACTVLVDGQAARSCIMPVASLVGKTVTTIEGLATAGLVAGQSPGNVPALHPVQRAWMDGSVAQCGYCQAGQIMAAVALLKKHPKPSDAQIDEAMAGNLCRCGTYQRVRQAIHAAAKALAS